MIKLSLHEIDFMLKTLSLPEELRNMLRELISGASKVITEDEADVLRDLCTDRLDTHGFDSDYNRTKEGEKLDALIDKLFVG